MKKSLNRRMFLRGAGGSILAIPYLPSLMTRAFASDPTPPPVGKCFMGIATEQGEIWGQNMYPSDDLFTQNMSYAQREVRYGFLPTTANENGRVVWSPVCQASAAVMTPTLAQKFNILRGLDICWDIGHQNGQNLGNFAQSGGGKVLKHHYAAPTIDQFAAYSPSFYTEADLATRMSQRSMCIESGRLSWNYVSPLQRRGDMVMQPAIRGNQDLYRFLFEPNSRYRGIDLPIVDGIKESYARLRRHPRLSKGDRARLDAHVERMADVERLIRLSASFESREDISPMPEANSEDIRSSTTFHTSPTQQSNYCDLIADMIVLAFSTGVCRIATWPNTLRFVSEFVSDWHGEIAHASKGAQTAQGFAVAYNQGTFEHIMVKLAAKLDDVITSDGQTLLDHSLLVWTNEHGQITHHSGVQYPVVTAGGAGGYFNTGNFVDFSDQNIVVQDYQGVIQDKPQLITESPGLYYHQFLANALMSMGVPPSEWEHFTEWTADGPEESEPTKGYGYHRVNSRYAVHYERSKALMSDPLPVITG